MKTYLTQTNMLSREVRQGVRVAASPSLSMKLWEHVTTLNASLSYTSVFEH